MLLNKHTMAAAASLCDILKPVVIFCDYLQGDVHFSRVNEKVENLIDELEHINIRFIQVGNGVHDEDLYFSKLPMIWDVIDDRREYARRLRAETPITIQQFAEEVARPMGHSLIQELQDAFHCSPALGAFSVFDVRHIPLDPLELVNYGQSSINHIADHYGEMKEDTFMGHHVVAHPEFPAESIRREFNAFKHQMFIMKQRATEDDLSDPQFLLKKLMDEPVLQQTFPVMSYFVLLSSLIPTSTACVERVFSLMNSICTPLRSSMSQETLDSIMRIVHEGATSISNTQLEKAIGHFTSKARKIDI